MTQLGHYRMASSARISNSEFTPVTPHEQRRYNSTPNETGRPDLEAADSFVPII